MVCCTEDIWNKGVTINEPNPKVFNILNTVGGHNIADQWENNKLWLNSAILRDDAIRVVSYPLQIDNIFFDTAFSNPAHFISMDALRNYMTNLSFNDSAWEALGVFGKEAHHLFNNGYLYDVATNKFYK